VEITPQRRTALEDAIVVSNAAFLESVKTHVLAALSRPLEGSIQFALP
jgi:hypothetical protein